MDANTCNEKEYKEYLEKFIADAVSKGKVKSFDEWMEENTFARNNPELEKTIGEMAFQRTTVGACAVDLIRVVYEDFNEKAYLEIEKYADDWYDFTLMVNGEEAVKWNYSEGEVRIYCLGKYKEIRKLTTPYVSKMLIEASGIS